MTAPTPHQFDREIAKTLARVKQRLADLPALYAYAYEAALGQVVHENAGKITTSEQPDPTGTIGFDHPNVDRPHAQAAIRRVLDRAPKKLAELENGVGAIEREILKAMDRLDPREGFEPLRYPISVSQDDLEKSREAQSRRANGTGTG